MSDPNPNPSPRPQQRFFDVVNPGQTAASPSSKPIIVSNRPVPMDPMMSPTRPAPPQMAPVIPVAAAPTPMPAAAPLPAAPPQEVAVPARPPQSKHRWRLMLPLVIGIVILFIAVDLLVDANIIHTSVTPLTNFFHHH